MVCVACHSLYATRYTLYYAMYAECRFVCCVFCGMRVALRVVRYYAFCVMLCVVHSVYVTCCGVVVSGCVVCVLCVVSYALRILCCMIHVV